ncbi:MAG: hypothetical protein J5685_04575 [Clostridiales bacterium]|nr:hypothetical protein [Clostridiales bacterium]
MGFMDNIFGKGGKPQQNAAPQPVKPVYRPPQKSRPVLVRFRTEQVIKFSDPEFGGVNVDIISYARASLTVNDLSQFNYPDPERKLEEMSKEALCKVLASYSGTMPSSKLQYCKQEIARKIGYELQPQGITPNNVEVVDISYTEEYRKLVAKWREDGFVTLPGDPEVKKPEQPKGSALEAEKETVPDYCPACGCKKEPGASFCDKCGFKFYGAS